MRIVVYTIFHFVTNLLLITWEWHRKTPTQFVFGTDRSMYTAPYDISTRDLVIRVLGKYTDVREELFLMEGDGDV